ncbi:MAG: hypothetical protein ACXVB9_03885 [Bdellovibrionota bacterium]
MKAIARFLVLLLLVCGTALAWKSNDRKFRHFVSADEGSRQKEEGEILQSVLHPMQSRSQANSADLVWSKTEFQTRLEEAFQKNDPCAVLELLHNTKDAAPREYWSAGMAVLLSQAHDKQPVLEELLANPESPIYGQPKEDSKQRETRFFNALVYSGQLRGLEENDDSPHRHGPRNLDKAIETFKALAQEDPDNGAYSYFLAGALRQGGAKKEEVHAALGQASKAPKFDTFYQSLFDELQTAAYSNVAAFAWVHSFLDAAPTPDYEIVTRYLKYWGHTEEPGKWIAYRLAKRLVEIGSKYKTHSPGYQFSRSEYLLGENLKYTIEGRMEKSWEDYMNKMREAQDFISESPKPVLDSEINLYRERIETKPSCGPDAWKSLYAAYRAKKEGA